MKKWLLAIICLAAFSCGGQSSQKNECNEKNPDATECDVADDDSTTGDTSAENDPVSTGTTAITPQTEEGYCVADDATWRGNVTLYPENAAELDFAIDGTRWNYLQILGLASPGPGTKENVQLRKDMLISGGNRAVEFEIMGTQAGLADVAVIANGRSYDFNDVMITTEWTRQRFSYTASGTASQEAAVVLYLGELSGDVSLYNLREGACEATAQ